MGIEFFAAEVSKNKRKALSVSPFAPYALHLLPYYIYNSVVSVRSP